MIPKSLILLAGVPNRTRCLPALLYSHIKQPKLL